MVSQARRWISSQQQKSVGNMGPQYQEGHNVEIGAVDEHTERVFPRGCFWLMTNLAVGSFLLVRDTHADLGIGVYGASGCFLMRKLQGISTTYLALISGFND